MTKNRLFTFLMISLIGGFVLTAPDSALAEASNAEKEKNVTDFINEYGIQKSQQGGNVLKRQDALKSAKEEWQKEYDSYKPKLEDLADKCAKTLGQIMKERYEKAVKEIEEKYGKTIDNIQNSDTILEGAWNAIKGGLSIRFTQIKHTLGAGKDILADTVKDFAIKHLDGLMKDSFAYTAQVGYVEGLCKDTGKTDFDKELEELKKQAAKLESLNYSKSLMDAEGYGDDIYVHCPPVTEGGCTADTTKGEDYESKCCQQFIVNTEKNTIMSISGASAGCPPLSFKLWEARSCLFCPLFKTIFNTIQTASTNAFATFSQPLSTLVLIGLSIWIAFMVLANVSSLSKQDAPKFLNELFKASFKVVIAFLLLRHASIVYDIIIGPLLKAGLDFGATFLSQTAKSGSMLSKCTYIDGATTAIGGVLPGYLFKHLMCFIEAVEYELGTTQAIGSALMCTSVNAARSNFVVVAKVMPDFTMMLQGAIIYIFSFILSLAFAFYLIDATVSLGIFGILLPFLLLCWPFKPTNGYFKKGVEVFMNSWFVYVFMGIVTNITLQLVGQSLSGGKGGFDAIMSAINSNYVTTLQSLLDIGFSGFLILIACCVFGIKLMMKVEGLAGKFAGGGLGLGIGNKIGGLAASAATNVTKAGVGMVTGAASSAYNAQIWEEKDKDGNYTGKFRSAHDGVRAVSNKMKRGVVRGIQRTAEGVGGAVSAVGRGLDAVGRSVTYPVRYMANSIRGNKRRKPSA